MTAIRAIERTETRTEIANIVIDLQRTEKENAIVTVMVIGNTEVNGREEETKMMREVRSLASLERLRMLMLVT